MRSLQSILSLLIFLGLVLPMPGLIVGLTFYLAPGWQMLPQQIAGVSIAIAFGAFLIHFMAHRGGIVPPFRRGVALVNKWSEAFASSPLVQRRLITAVAAHRVYLLFLLLLFPILAYAPAILHGIWEFLAEGFAKNAFVGCIVALMIAFLLGLVGFFYGILVYVIVKKQRWEIWAPVDLGFLYFAFVCIVYGVSLGFSLFGESPEPGAWAWWLRLWMGWEFAVQLVRFSLLMGIDKFSAVDLEPRMKESMQGSDRSMGYGLGLYALAGLIFLWSQGEGVSHATATALMVALALDRGYSLLRPQATGAAEGARIQGDAVGAEMGLDAPLDVGGLSTEPPA